ncbi:MAG: sulfatase-like hydrolase/transferase [Acidobacteria bacterium]|nr:sulfatase-like hydrolase/transferase [Acidobacteriota bacterium]
MNALRRRGLLDNTVFVFTSDNGYLLGEHGQFDNKRFAHEESLRVPFILRYPRLVRPGTKVDALALNIDVAPTLLELAGAEPLEKVQGRSLLPLLEGRAAGWRESFLAEYFLEKVAPRAPTWQAVRTARWKYIHYPDLEGMDELYDLAADPGEVRNLINDPASRPALEAMKAELERLRQSTR